MGLGGAYFWARARASHSWPIGDRGHTRHKTNNAIGACTHKTDLGEGRNGFSCLVSKFLPSAPSLASAQSRAEIQVA
eukprot:3712081-Rhodomonas_salina.1